jgi:hypothetical protein
VPRRWRQPTRSVLQRSAGNGLIPDCQRLRLRGLPFASAATGELWR